ncbi:MAG: serine hydrolase domain-containing protein [Acidimicrobiales bacterium]
MDRRLVARVSRVGICAVLFASACSSDTDIFDDLAAQQAAESATFPGADWAVGDPAELGFDPALLEEIAAEADPETSCLLVTRHGEIVGEWYWNGFTEDQQDVVMSVTQTYTSTLIGIAQDEGLLDVDDPVAEYVPEWAGTPSEDVTIRDILGHVTGRESTNSIGNTELYDGLLNAPDPGEFAVGLAQEHDPGTVWSQNLPALEVLEPILKSVTGMEPAAYAQEKLFAPIGATHTQMGETGGGETWMHTFLQTTCRDAARFGYLFLRNGDWNGSEVVSQEWVEEATHPSQELNPGFGYMWWLNEPGSLVSIENILTPDYDEPSNLQLNPEAPLDMYWAVGFGGRLIQIHPETDTVVVRLGGGDEASNMQQVTRLVTEALIE